MNKKVEELKKQLAAAEAEERQQREDARKEYENGRDGLVVELCSDALHIYELLVALKNKSTQKLNEHRVKMLEYGDLRRGQNNKGSFELKTLKFKVVHATQVIKKFDERAFVAEKKINEFLKRWLKKKDRNTYDFINNLLKRDETTGQFDINMINQLYTMEDRFDDPDWKEGIWLFKQSYAPYNTAVYTRFYIKNETTGGWDCLMLDFAKIKPTVKIEKEVSCGN